MERPFGETGYRIRGDTVSIRSILARGLLATMLSAVMGAALSQALPTGGTAIPSGMGTYKVPPPPPPPGPGGLWL
ncbi:hypothetical protein GCM10009557_31170 [Virgisporangium ochraceum]|uniref:Uncharacterized protein n=1 Tax=Virgisporangium ochraceum TaxID=65505 RepID=A0A8J4A8E2_9ACTN|nr:hypothetical protein Voc01_097430 [Virgisporangium ochraceum]